MPDVKIKTQKEIETMLEGGRKLSKIKERIKKFLEPGKNAKEIEDLAAELVQEEGGTPSFKEVPGYSWTTCVNINEGVVHGIPHSNIVFEKGDIVSIDIGFYYKGFHTDSAFSVLLGKDPKKQRFLNAGKISLNRAIKKVRPGRKIGDVSEEIEKNIRKAGFAPIESLTGHGIGRDLHEAPRIPCIVKKIPDEQVVIKEGMVLAVEVMYTEGSSEVEVVEDGWTVRTKNGRMAALFEETVALSGRGRVVLTA